MSNLNWWKRACAVCVLCAATIAARAQSYSVLYTFTGGTDGGSPAAGLIADSAGNLYGTTQSGGNFSSSCIAPYDTCGVVFKLDQAGTETVLYSFTAGADGLGPSAGLVRDEAGNLYGTTLFGGDTSCDPSRGCGVLFKLDSAGSEAVLHSFGRADGKVPAASLIRDPAGSFYGTTSEGGNLTGLCSPDGCGVVFKLDPTGQHYKVLYRFTGGADGASPRAPLVRDAAGNLYGTAAAGGKGSSTCPFGASGCGVVFKIDPLGNETVLYSFTGKADGGTPEAGLIRDAAGNLYGTTVFGGTNGSSCPNGSNGCGVVFELAPSGDETVLYTFTGAADGWAPYASLIRDPAGNLYSTTQYGGNSSSSCPLGSFGCGVVFKLAPSGNETVLYTFSGGADGYWPIAGLSLVQGSLYGTAFEGGAFGYGVVFKITLK
jgi:uncharacterized repeat protein (TIGR03803 family)